MAHPNLALVINGECFQQDL